MPSLRPMASRQAWRAYQPVTAYVRTAMATQPRIATSVATASTVFVFVEARALRGLLALELAWQVPWERPALPPTGRRTSVCP